MSPQWALCLYCSVSECWRQQPPQERLWSSQWSIVSNLCCQPQWNVLIMKSLLERGEESGAGNHIISTQTSAGSFTCCLPTVSRHVKNIIKTIRPSGFQADVPTSTTALFVGVKVIIFGLSQRMSNYSQIKWRPVLGPSLVNNIITQQAKVTHCSHSSDHFSVEGAPWWNCTAFPWFYQ